MWILLKMRFWKYDFLEKCEFEHVIFWRNVDFAPVCVLFKELSKCSTIAYLKCTAMNHQIDDYAWKCKVNYYCNYPIEYVWAANHTVKKLQTMSENSIFWKNEKLLMKLNFYAKNCSFLKIFKGKNHLNNWIYTPKIAILIRNRIIKNFDNFWRENSKSKRKVMYKNPNQSLIFGTKIQIHNFVIFFLKIDFLDRIVLTVCVIYL